MVVLTENSSFGTVTLKVPFIEGAEVTFSQDVSVNGMKKIVELSKKKAGDLTEEENKEYSNVLAKEIIKDWNFATIVDGVEVKLPITAETIDSKMPKRLRSWMQEQIFSFFAKGEAKAE